MTLMVGTIPSRQSVRFGRALQSRIYDARLPVNEAKLRLIAQRYMFRNKERSAHFLYENPYLVPLLADAAQQILTYFPDAPLALEVVTDPEGNTHPSLVVAVPTSLEPEQAIGRLDRFDEAWWFDAADRAQGKLIISLEYL